MDGRALHRSFCSHWFYGWLHQSCSQAKSGTHGAGKTRTASTHQPSDRGNPHCHAEPRHVLDQAGGAILEAVSSRPGGGPVGSQSEPVADCFSAFHYFRCADDRRSQQRSEPDWWAWRPGDWLHSDCRWRADRAYLCQRSCDILDLPGIATHAFGRRAGDFLWRDGGRSNRISLV